jgi:hypothetical protein
MVMIGRWEPAGGDPHVVLRELSMCPKPTVPLGLPDVRRQLVLALPKWSRTARLFRQARFGIKVAGRPAPPRTHGRIAVFAAFAPPAIRVAIAVVIETINHGSGSRRDAGHRRTTSGQPAAPVTGPTQWWPTDERRAVAGPFKASSWWSFRLGVHPRRGRHPADHSAPRLHFA